MRLSTFKISYVKGFILVLVILCLYLYECSNSTPIEIGRKHLSSNEPDDPSGKSGDTMLSFRAYGNSSGAGSSTSITIMFILDITKDMPQTPINYIGSIISSIDSIVSNLQTQGFSQIKIGYTTYTDTVSAPYTATDQYDTLKNSLAYNVSFLPGGDLVEAGLLGISRTVEYLKSSSTTDYKVMVLITNEFSHEDSGDYQADEEGCSNRHCCKVTGNVSNALNSISSAAKNNYKLFYIVPERDAQGCIYSPDSNFTSPREQLDALLQGTLGSQGGGWLCWAGNGDIAGCLTYTLTDQIGSLTGVSGTNPSGFVCLIEGAQFDILGNKISYKSSFQKQYQYYKNGQDSSVKITNQQIIDAVKAGKIQDGSVTVTQACFSESDAESGNFNSPATTRDQSITYSLEYIK